MAKNRDDRYATTEDMLEDLKAVRRGEAPPHARRELNVDARRRWSPRGRRWTSRRRR